MSDRDEHRVIADNRTMAGEVFEGRLTAGDAADSLVVISRLARKLGISNTEMAALIAQSFGVYCTLDCNVDIPEQRRQPLEVLS